MIFWCGNDADRRNIFCPFGRHYRLRRVHLIGLFRSGASTLFSIILNLQLNGNLPGILGALGGGVLAGLTIAIIQQLRHKTSAVPIFFSFCFMGTLVSAGQMLMTYGFKFCQSWEGGMVLFTEVISAVFIGVFFFGDQLTLRFGIGSLMIFISVMAMQMGLRHPATRID